MAAAIAGHLPPTSPLAGAVAFRDEFRKVEFLIDSLAVDTPLEPLRHAMANLKRSADQCPNAAPSDLDFRECSLHDFLDEDDFKASVEDISGDGDLTHDKYEACINAFKGALRRYHSSVRSERTTSQPRRSGGPF
jgi:hypothetical protein